MCILFCCRHEYGYSDIQKLARIVCVSSTILNSHISLDETNIYVYGIKIIHFTFNFDTKNIDNPFIKINQKCARMKKLLLTIEYE